MGSHNVGGGKTSGGSVLTGTWASEDEENSDLVVIKGGCFGRRSLSGGRVGRLLVEMKGFGNLVNNGRHVVGKGRVLVMFRRRTAPLTYDGVGRGDGRAGGAGQRRGVWLPCT